MIEITATDLRKDLFSILDRIVETGEDLRVTRKGKATVTFKARLASTSEVEQRAARFDAAMAMGVREDDAKYDPGDITDGSHLDWAPEDTPR
ncbi:type II toxin-antitoxin system Phd/YefM family antitoxin [Brevundimonas bacteroides]|uniref:type II toxin-antitoxin system Phd/YefM family antitoxin n=1 Tax=Brevundimonas bacteroides TaxID=74311 RepID=UPI000A63E9F6|nr:type II toxin-antitoxin system Phd/YefM family antitoxin [Brevundimonas bacteroides]